MSLSYNGHSKRRVSKLAFSSRLVAIRYAIHLPRTYWRTDTISERFKNYWGTLT